MTDHAPLILDIAGTTLSAADRRRLVHPLTGGVILFARNWKDRAQLCRLTRAIKALRQDVLICVDHERGRVQRLRTDGFTHLPPMAALGTMWINDGKGAKAVSGSGALRATNAATAAGRPERAAAVAGSRQSAATKPTGSARPSAAWPTSRWPGSPRSRSGRSRA